MREMLLKLAAGAVGGAVATYLLQKSMALVPMLPERARPLEPAQDPGQFMMQKGERVVGELSPKMHTMAVQGLRWGYGVTWPLALAGLSGVLGLRSVRKTLAAGAILGAVVWAVGYVGWMPAAGLVPWPHRVPLGKSLSGLASHVAYGAMASLPLAMTAPRVQP